MIEESRFLEACELADEESASTANPACLHNKILALLNLGRYEDAISVTNLIAESSACVSDILFIRKAIALWFLNRRAEAVTAWWRAVDADYVDAAGGVQAPLHILYAAARMNNLGLKSRAIVLLKRRVKGNQAINWPGPLAEYMLGLIDAEGLSRRISPEPIVRSRERCQVLFYMALQKLLSGDADEFYNLLKESVAQSPVSRLEAEYYIAAGELHALPQ